MRCKLVKEIVNTRPYVGLLLVFGVHLQLMYVQIILNTYMEGSGSATIK